MSEMDIVQRLERRPDTVQGSRLIDCLDAAAEIVLLRSALAAARAEGIAQGRAEMREEAALVCDRFYNGYAEIAAKTKMPAQSTQHYFGRSTGAERCAVEIRALPPSADGERG